MNMKLLSSEFKGQSNVGILRLIATAGKRNDVDCMNLTHFCPQTAEAPVYVFVSNNDVVVLLLNWGGKDEVEESPVWQLTLFTRQYQNAMEDAGIHLSHISSVLVTNAEIINYENLLPLWEQKNVIVYHNIQMEQLPYVHFSFRYHAVARPQFVAFRQWCELKGYLPYDRYAYEDIDADYDEIEFGIDDDEDENAFLEDYLSAL